MHNSGLRRNFLTWYPLGDHARGTLRPHAVAVPAQVPHKVDAPRVLKKRPERLPDDGAVHAPFLRSHGRVGELATAAVEAEKAVAVVTRRGADHMVLGEGAWLVVAALHRSSSFSSKR